VNHDGGTAIAEKRVGVVAESNVVIFHFPVGFAFRVDGKVLHVSGVVAFRIFESVLLALRIEMSAGGLEVGTVALGSLMKVDGVLAGRQIVKMKLQGDALSLLPYEDVSDSFALGVFEFDLGFGGAGKRGGKQNGGEGDEEKSKVVHAGNYRTLWPSCTNVPCWFHSREEYTSVKFEILSGKSALMAVNAVEQVTEQVPADDFQALEEKIYRTIEMYKAARQAQAAAERDAQRARQQLEEREEQLTSLRRESVQLKKEREDIRGRVEKMLEQIESIAEERAS
jgi:hypothetical protein